MLWNYWWKLRPAPGLWSSVLTQALSGVFALPLACRIHEGAVFSKRDHRTLLDKTLLRPFAPEARFKNRTRHCLLNRYRDARLAAIAANRQEQRSRARSHSRGHVYVHLQRARH